MCGDTRSLCYFFFNDTATTEIYTLSLHDALPILSCRAFRRGGEADRIDGRRLRGASRLFRQHHGRVHRSEEHTSELQSRQYLVCRLLLEKKNTRLTSVLNPGSHDRLT